MNRIRGGAGELSLDDRIRRMRRARRRLAYQRLTGDALWIGIIAVLGVAVVTELLAAVGRG